MARTSSSVRSRRRLAVVALVAGAALAAACSESLVIPGASTTVPATEPASTEPASTEPASSDPAVTEPVSTDPPDTTPDTVPEASPPTTVEGETGGIEWSAVVDGVQQGTLQVPLDHADPTGEQITIAMSRHRANDPSARIGTLLVNPGGPGYGGSVLAEQADAIYQQTLLDHFDIVGFDPRGTGLSEPHIDCIDDYDPVFGIETGPDNPAEDQVLQAAAATFVQGCIDRSGDLLAHVGTDDAAKDMDLIRQALGEREISYFGWSYGTDLGATWATLFPDTVRAAVLDGSIDPTVGRVDGLVQQAAGFDATLSTYLADCSGDTACAFHNDGNAEQAFLDLLVQIETTKIPTADGRPDLDQGIFELAVADALYSDAQWPQLSEALAAAQQGDGSGLLALYDEYYGRGDDGSYGDELEAYFAITCADDPATGGIQPAVDARGRFFAASPRLGTSAAFEVLVCATFGDDEPAAGITPPAPRTAITGKGAGPIVVVGNTGDPATPYEGSKRMATTLEDGVFVSVEANVHTAYGLNDCIDGTIDDYLVDLKVPAVGTSC